jgi:hypothetical protein
VGQAGGGLQRAGSARGFSQRDDEAPWPFRRPGRRLGCGAVRISDSGSGFRSACRSEPGQPKVGRVPGKSGRAQSGLLLVRVQRIVNGAPNSPPRTEVGTIRVAPSRAGCSVTVLLPSVGECVGGAARLPLRFQRFGPEGSGVARRDQRRPIQPPVQAGSSFRLGAAKAGMKKAPPRISGEGAVLGCEHRDLSGSAPESQWISSSFCVSVRPPATSLQ